MDQSDICLMGSRPPSPSFQELSDKKNLNIRDMIDEQDAKEKLNSTLGEFYRNELGKYSPNYMMNNTTDNCTIKQTLKEI